MLGTLPYPDKTQVEWEEKDGKIRPGVTYITVGGPVGTYYRYLSATGRCVDYFRNADSKITFPDPAGTSAVILKVNTDPVKNVPVGNYLLFPSTYADYIGSKPEAPQPAPQPAITPQKQRMLDFAKNPDIIKFFGTLPDTTLNVFSRVFWHYDIYDDKPVTPDTTDYASVGLILAGSALGAAAALYSVVTALGLGTGTMTGTAAVTVDTMPLKIAIHDLVQSISVKTAGIGIMGIFAITEIPNLILMIQFARNQLAQEAGTTSSQLERKLQDYENALKNAGISFSQAAKAGDLTAEQSILSTMQDTLIKYKAEIDAQADRLKALGMYDNTMALYKTFADAIAVDAATLPSAILPVLQALPEVVSVQVTAVTDGDTVTAKTQVAPIIEFPVRILGENAPDKNLNVVWVKSLINGVETRYELTAADYKAANEYAVVKLLRVYATLQTDPANRVDKYGRVLGVIRYGPLNTDFGLELVKNGLAVAYLEGTNKYVDSQAYIDAQNAAQSVGAGMWKTIAAANNGTIDIKSKPTNSKLYIDGTYTNHYTPEKVTLPAGSHEVRITRSGYDDYIEKVDVVANTTAEVYAELQRTGIIPPSPAVSEGATTTPLISPGQTTGTLVLSSSPSNVKILVDGADVHHRTPETLVLDAGLHTITLRKVKYSDWIKTYTIVAGSTIYDNADMTVAGAAIPIETTEADAKASLETLMRMFNLNKDDIIALLGA